jgi:hypothetical protein
MAVVKCEQHHAIKQPVDGLHGEARVVLFVTGMRGSVDWS